MNGNKKEKVKQKVYKQEAIKINKKKEEKVSKKDNKFKELLEKFKKLSKKEKTNYIIVLVSILLVLVTLIGITVAFFTASVGGNEKARETVVETANLALVFRDTENISMYNALPGQSITKTFTVENVGDVTLDYDITVIDVKNTFVGGDLVYTLTSTNGGATAERVPLPLDSDKLVTATIDPGVTQTYTITILFLETGSDQNANQGAIFNGKLQINAQNMYSYTGDDEESSTSTEASGSGSSTTEPEIPYSFGIDATFGQVLVGESIETNITYTGEGTISCEVASGNSSAARCDVVNNKLRVTGLASGSVTFNITETERGDQLQYSVQVYNPSISIEENSDVIGVGGTKTYEITGQDYGQLSCSIDNGLTNATCDIVTSGGNYSLQVTGITAGDVVVRVTENRKNLSDTINISVKDVELGLSKTSETLYVGGSSSTVTITGNYYGDITVKSGCSASVATCTLSGNTITVKPIGDGSTSITIKEGNAGKEATYTVTVKEVTLTLNSTGDTLYVGGSAKTVSLNTNASSNVGTLSCKSSNDSYATCSVSGNNIIVTPVAAGTATITVTESNAGKTATYTATVSATGISIGSVGTLYVGGSAKTVSVTGTNMGTLSISSACNTSIATCTLSGTSLTITPKAAGTTSVTVKEANGNKTATQSIKVETTSISLSRTTSTVTEGERTSVGTITKSSNAGTVTCSTNNGSCSISGNTVYLTASTDGSATVTVKEANGNKSASITISVEPESNVYPVSVTCTIAPGGTTLGGVGVTQTFEYGLDDQDFMGVGDTDDEALFIMGDACYKLCESEYDPDGGDVSTSGFFWGITSEVTCTCYDTLYSGVCRGSEL
ncbi:MAG: hypothetical protein IJO57_02590 [Bacilli bacterium]|nr:hypothetical protein [Bacilli bacterium]